VTRDEFGGYCCKRFFLPQNNQTQSTGNDNSQNSEFQDNLCNLLGIDIDKLAWGLVEKDYKSKKDVVNKENGEPSENNQCNS
jgi:myosin heavy subunit